MSLASSVKVVELYITQYSNGSVTYVDTNGQTYIPYYALLNEDDGNSVINTSIDLESMILFATISLLLVLFGGITSGLNVSLLSIDAKKNKLMTKLAEKNSNLISSSKIKMMETLQPLIDDRHLLLVTLLVANASCMEALPIFLDELVASWLAVVISVTFVLIFGEILPQALFTSDPLKSGYKLYYLVLSMKWILFPICKPLAFMLDLLFGAEHKQKGIVFSQAEVSMIMDEIQTHPDERTVVEGALKIADYTVMESIIPWKEVVCFDANSKLDTDGLREIYKTGFSRIPIYEHHRDNIIGILLVKTLILCDPDPNLTLKEYLTINFKKIPNLTLVSPQTPLYDTINVFQEKKSHFAMVCQEMDKVVILESWRDGKVIPEYIEWCGIITLEDIMEDIIQEEINDEFDIQSPLQAVIEKSEHLNWTHDQLFAESVKSRFSAKNKRTLRARQLKNIKGSNQLQLAIAPAMSENVFDFHEKNKEKIGSQSHPSLLSKPLLSDNTSINVKQ